MNPESVKARLKNYAKMNSLTFQEVLTYYGIERAIYRVSISDYANRFILKGGIFLYAIFDGKYSRATTDIDFLGRRVSNSRDELEAIFKSILSQDLDDALIFDIDSINVEEISELKEYHGLRISTTAYLDRTRIPISIDIGFGDVIYPNVVKMDFPSILDMPSSNLNVYSLESAVAEKLESIVKNGFWNSRYKDFYDLYILSKNFKLHYCDLRNAAIETFKNRNTEMTMNTAAFSEEFAQDSLHIKRWSSFVKKKKAIVALSLQEALARIKIFVAPLFEVRTDLSAWNPEDGVWKTLKKTENNSV